MGSTYLVLSIIGTADSVQINSFFLAFSTDLDTVNNPVQQIKFASGLAFNLGDIQLGSSNPDTLTGGVADSIMMGGAGNDILNGNSGNDLLNGGLGADNMNGGLGNDMYIVDNLGDSVTENPNEGIDQINSAITHTLSANFENLLLTGTLAINGSGNAVDNVLTGNSANNPLSGLAGNDTLNGQAGSDTVLGGLGKDIYLFNRGGNADTWIENDATAGNTDIARYGADIAHDQLWSIYSFPSFLSQ